MNIVKNYQSPEFKELTMIQEGVLCSSSGDDYDFTPGGSLGSDSYIDEL